MRIAVVATVLAAAMSAGEVAPTLSPEQAQARYRQPADITIGTTLVSEPAAAFSLCSGELWHRYNQLSPLAGCEPLTFRTKKRVIADDPHLIRIPSDPRMAEGFYDGAIVRVYHPVDGVMTLIRKGVVPPGGHANSSWRPINNRARLQAPAEATTYACTVGKTWKPGVDYWFQLRTIAENGMESPDGPTVRVRVDEPGKQGEFPGVDAPRAGNVADARPVAPPATLDARYESQGRVVLSWPAISAKGLAGFTILVTDVDPARHRGSSIALADDQPRPDQAIQAGDLVFIDCEKPNLPRTQLSAMNWTPNRKTMGLPPWMTEWPDAHPGRSWILEPHPQPVPEALAAVGGRACLHLLGDGVTPLVMPLFQHAGTDQDWYYSFQAVEHRISFWAMADARMELSFSFVDGPYHDKIPVAPITATVEAGTGWKPYELKLTIPQTVHRGVGRFALSVNGAGNLWLDHLGIGESDRPFGRFEDLALKQLASSGMRWWRTHEPVKTNHGYSLAGFTNEAGGLEQSVETVNTTPATLPVLLRHMQAARISPWLQVEMCFSEEEWLGLVEYLAAPFDPAVDTPAVKPWAWKRHAQGQHRPWTDEFPEWMFEISNETWNPLFAPWNFDMGMRIRDGKTGAYYTWGETYGLYFQHVIGTMQRSPYWTPAVAAKFRFMLGGWATNLNYGADAASRCPAATDLSYASYNSSRFSDEKFSDDKLFALMPWAQTACAPRVDAQMQASARAAGVRGAPVATSIYETGPSYAVTPPVSADQSELQGRLQRGLVSGNYLLDGMLHRAMTGYRDQAFFTYGRRTGSWGSHTLMQHGGHAYPTWMAMEIYNRHGTGSFLDNQVAQMPVWSIPAVETQDNTSKVKRPAVPDMPMVSVYATTAGDRVTVFLISKKLDGHPVSGDDGFTPVTLRLPFTAVGGVVLHRIQGDARVDNRTAERIKTERIELPASAFHPVFTIDGKRGADPRGLPPAAVYAYEFSDIRLPPLNHRPELALAAPGIVEPRQPITLSAQAADADGDRLTWNWSAADQSGTGETMVFTPPRPGSYKVRVAVEDGRGGKREQAAEMEAALRIADQPWRLRINRQEGAILPDARIAGATIQLSGSGAISSRNLVRLSTIEATSSDLVWEATVTGVQPATAAISSKKTVVPLAGIALVEPEPGVHSGPMLAVSIGSAGAGLWSRDTRTVAPIPGMALPMRIRIERRGETVTAAIRQGEGWTTVGKTRLARGREVSPAFILGSENSGVEAMATFSDAVLQIRQADPNAAEEIEEEVRFE